MSASWWRLRQIFFPVLIMNYVDMANAVDVSWTVSLVNERAPSGNLQCWNLSFQCPRMDGAHVER